MLQVLLLLRQSALEGELPQGLRLNGSLVHLGNAGDALNIAAQTDEIAFELETDGGLATWRFAYDRESDVLSGQGQVAPPDDPLFGSGFQYLSAERIGPRVVSQMADHQVRVGRQLGVCGEFAAHFLAVHGETVHPLESLRHPDAASIGLRSQVEAWLGTVSPGIRMGVASFADMDAVRLRYSFADTPGHAPDDHRPPNVGFGVSYVLPVLVAILAAEPGHLILLENPEAHLHPRGQFEIGRLAARAAAAGIQLIVETHSDHMLNGVRVAARHGEIAPDDVRLHFFRRYGDELGSDVEVLSPRLDTDGRIDAWPEGFFDEWDRALEDLIRPRGEDE